MQPNGAFDVVDDSGNSVLQYTAASSGGVLALVKPEVMAGIPSADYYVEAKIRPRKNSTTGNKQLYLLTRYVDGNNWYGGALNVQNDTASTQVEIVRNLAGTIQRPKQVKKPIAQGEAGALDGTWYSLRIEVLGSNLTVYLDGETIATHTDTSFTEKGMIGLWTANKSFEIDDVKVGNANDKPASLLLSPSASSYAAEVGDDARVISVTAKTDAGATDTFSVDSSNPSVVTASVNGTDVTLTPVGDGSATISITSGSGLVRSITATIAPAFVMPTATYSFTNQLVPAAGEVNAYEDLTLKLTFDAAPTLGTTGSIRIFKTSDDTMVDKISLANESDSIGFGTLRALNTRPVRISGNTASISLHANKLEANTSYYVAISPSVFTGANLAGQTFEGIGENANWSFTTRAAKPAAGLTTVVVDDNGTTADFRSVQGALNYVMEHVALNDAVTIEVKEGVYEEPLYLRNKNNLTIRGESREGTVIQYPNNNGLNPSTNGRALFLVESADMLALENLTLKNTTLIGAGGQAETIYFNSTNGRLVAKNANFISEQDTLLLKGWTWFYNTLVAGNVDFIWGYSKVSLFEKSEIRSLGRSSSNANGGYILQARVESATDKGFVFLNSSVTSGAGPTNELPIDGSHYLARSPGSSGSTVTYDNIVFVNTKIGTHINTAGWAASPIPTPATATATAGWREYGSMDLNGNTLNVSGRLSPGSYQMSLGEVMNDYCSRAQIFSAYNSGAGWDPMPEDTSDCVDVDGTGGSSSSAASSVESSASSSEASSSAASSEASSSAASSEASSDSSSSASSDMGGGSSESSSSSSAAGININWSPSYDALASAVASAPAANSNANFNATLSPITIGDFKFYSSGSGSLRLHLNAAGDAYAVNYNGTALKDDSTAAPVTLVEGTSGQVNPTTLNAAGGVTRFVSYPLTTSSNGLSVTVTYTNGSGNYDAVTAPNGCLNGQIALVDQSGKTWKVASSCGNSVQNTITATITDNSVTELYVLMSRNGDGGGGIRIWNIAVSQ